MHIRGIALFLTANLLLVLNCLAQDGCTSPPLGHFFNTLKDINVNEHNVLKYKKYPDFRFSDFMPVDGAINDSDYFEIGYSASGMIKEIVHFEKNRRLQNYKFLIFEFHEYRILILKLLVGKDYKFTPTVIFMMKGMIQNYMINTVPQFGVDNPYTSLLFYDTFPIKEFKDISAMMNLDERLYPISMIRISKGQIVMSSDIEYEEDHSMIIKRELVEFYLYPEPNSKLQISYDTCPVDLFRDKVPHDIVLALHPEIYSFTTAPLWIYSGAHTYK